MKFKKNIKESDDWSWTQRDPNIWFSYQILVFDEAPTINGVIKFITDALDSGFVIEKAIESWESEDIGREAEIISRYAKDGTQPYLRIDLNDGWLYYGEYYSDLKNKFPESKTIKFSEAKNYTINESEENEWDWLKGEIKLPKTKTELEEFVGWSFVWDMEGLNCGGEWGYGGRQWKIISITDKELQYKDMDTNSISEEWVDLFIERISEGSWVLLSPEGVLFDPMCNRTYSKTIKESDDDFKWIQDISPKDINFRIGDVIKVHNVGDEDSFLEWLGDFSDDFLDNRFGEFIIGKIVGLNNKRIEIRERHTNESIFFPTYLDMENVRTNGGLGWTSYTNLDIYYEILGDEN